MRYATKIKLFVSFIVLVFFYACANIGQGPQGGPYDFDPPILVHSTPHSNATNVQSKKIELTFNENIDLNNVSQKLIVTPPQKRMPIVTATNKKVYVELRDTLQANTTYVVDFSDAIQDYNQNNPLANFSLAFSTGESIDSLQISGKLLMAENNEPVKGYYVGLHSNLSDTAFIDIQFPHISRTNDNGEFTLKGLKGEQYHIFALEDKGRNYKYTSLDEYIAFDNQLIEPRIELAHIHDTIFNKIDTTKIDSIIPVNVSLFLPNDIVLKAFRSSVEKQYFVNTNRSDAHRFELNFGGLTEEPKIVPLNFEESEDWYIKERNLPQDSIFMYWITDKNLIAKDSLQFEMTYHKTDTLFQLQTVVDTIYALNRTRKTEQKEKKKKKGKEVEEDEIIFLDFKDNVESVFEIYDSIQIEFGEPIKSDLKSLIRLERKIDTIYTPIDYTLVQDSLNPRKYYINNKWGYGDSYRIGYDSAKVVSIYDLYADKWNKDFKIRSIEDYANLQFNISGLDTDSPLLLQLLDEKGVPVRQTKVRNNVAKFRSVVPKKYYARVIVDSNDNNKWDSGNFFENKQPEAVYYYPKAIELRAFWDATENFHINPLVFEKPKELLKNKPVEQTAREKLMEKEDKERYQREKEMQRQRDIADGKVSQYGY